MGGARTRKRREPPMAAPWQSGVPERVRYALRRRDFLPFAGE
jgi:hypothetical protein